MVSVAPVSAPVAAKLAAVAATEAVSVPVDTSPTVVKFPALAVLLMVSVRQQVRYQDRLSLEGAGPDLHAVQVQLLHQPGDGAAEGSEVQLRDSARRHQEVQARRAPDALRGRAEEGAGDAHVVVVGRADVHHQVGGRAQPVPATEGVASPRHQRVGAHDVPGEGAQGHGVAR